MVQQRLPRKFKEVDNKEFENSMIKNLLRGSIDSEIKAKFAKQSKINGFTLPGTSFLLEKGLIDYYKSRVKLECVESKKVVFAKSDIMAKSVVFNKNLKLYNTTDLKYFKKHTDKKFNFMWLDYCGPYTKGKIDSLKLIFKNNLDFSKGKPIIGITLMNGMDFYELKNIRNLSLLYGDKLTKGHDGIMNVRIAGIPGAINEIAKQYGKTIYPKIIFNYCDKYRNKRSVTMLLFIFEVMDRDIDYKIWNTQVISMTNELLLRKH